MYWRKIFITLIFGLFLPLQSLSNEQNLEILKALMLADEGKNIEAMKIYEKLFNTTKDGAYIKEAIRLAINSQDTKKLDELLKKGKNQLKNDTEFNRMLIIQHISKSEFEPAKKIALELIKKEKTDARNFIILGGIYIFTDNEKEAIKSFEKAYDLDGSEESVMRLASVLLSKTKDDKTAQKYLENFKTRNGCTINVCETLTEIYANNKKFDLVASTSKELFSLSEDENHFKRALGAYIIEGDTKGFEELIKSNPIDDELASKGYAELKEFKKAYDLAKSSFERTKEPQMQALMAIYEYENAREKPDKKTLKNIIENFEASVSSLNDALYFNYYGYLLIDHDIDIKKGIELVQKALEIEPDSVYYIDSLAWGYYKLGKCKAAKDEMAKALKDEEFAKDDEAIKHKKAIDECKEK
ncbi:hypothetical protein U5B43_03900 [Campylobacter sp. 9BO]|uniref:tetratricopeptide repeat protein n=1 Tax=Campylobacter sp. 9BO TaxID=3424759 RepID=UPI003D353837